MPDIVCDASPLIVLANADLLHLQIEWGQSGCVKPGKGRDVSRWASSGPGLRPPLILGNRTG
jgi:hypothetical protein